MRSEDKKVATPALEPETNSGLSQIHAPRHLSFADNVILTMKVLIGVALVGVALWAANLWTTAS